MRGRPGLLLVSLVAASAALRFWAATRIPSPWITPDEQTYAELGRSLWHSGRFEILGRSTEPLSLVHPDFRGRRVGDTAARLLQRHLIFDLGFHRLELEVYGFNERAIAHAERSGFVREGVKRRGALTPQRAIRLPESPSELRAQPTSASLEPGAESKP